MLSIINERVFDNGGTRIDVPMISLYGASNELPQGAELSALWDRFTVRASVDYVSKAAFPRLIQMAAERPSSGMLRVARNNKAHTLALPPPNVVLQPADLFSVITAAAHMPIPQDVRDAVGKLYSQLADNGIIISDRRSRSRKLSAAAMLTANDDNQRSETPVSVATLPPQEPARCTAPVIAGLIDDDPNHPF